LRRYLLLNRPRLEFSASFRQRVCSVTSEPGDGDGREFDFSVHFLGNLGDVAAGNGAQDGFTGVAHKALGGVGFLDQPYQVRAAAQGSGALHRVGIDAGGDGEQGGGEARLAAVRRIRYRGLAELGCGRDAGDRRS
jgi:hypothetical protein